MSVHGLPTEKMSPVEEVMLIFLYGYLPSPPVSTSPSLCCAAAADDKNDHVSRLPDNLLRRVVSLLPAKDGARTAVLSSRWRGIWRSAPTVLVDTHLLPSGDGERRPARASAVSRAVTAAVSAVLESHPGPFPFVSLTCSFMMDGAHSGLLERWFQLLATKGVDELVFVNRSWPPSRALPLPSSLFSCASLCRLFIGAWVFPDTAALPRGTAFPNLRHLVLGCVAIKDYDLEFVLAASPVLEVLTVTGSLTPLRARLTSHSLRCVQLCLSTLEEVALVDAPSLERLFIYKNWNERHGLSNVKTTVKIGHAPKLRVLGYLEPGVHVLQISNTIIEAGTKASMHTTVPSVQMLAVQLQFAFCSEVEMLPSFLRCFPSVETLVVESRAHRETLINLHFKIWQQASPIECVRSHLKTLAFHELQGKHNEFAFLKFIAENARRLERMFILIKNELSYTERQVVAAGVGSLYCANWASRDCNVQYKISSLPVGCSTWSLPRGSDLFLDDPFEAFREE
ncbi:putative F-box protein At3g44060 [Lolium rigidum]|uniref:putative F-box protein At3g44060 n=1 Tax=Lolium rigidum TaxID=89674 RepID=UPI001F5D92B4|nr:putative F-box protein At3g44060 [Lolium rigidum]